MKTFSTRPGREQVAPVSCALCGGRDARPWLSGEAFRFVRCRSCGLVYQDPQPLFADLKQRYGEQYFRYELENEENFFNLMVLGLQDIRFDELTADLKGPRRILDIGCATGRLLAFLRDRGFAAQGVELCPESVRYGRTRRGLEIFNGTLEEAGFSGSSYSVVHFSHLIEHVPNPRTFLREVHRVLSDDGYLIAVTPNVAGLQARLFGVRWRSAIADHLTLFSVRTLRAMLEDCGFDVVRTVTWGGLAKGTVPQALKRPVDRLAKRLGFGDVMLMLAVKR